LSQTRGALHSERQLFSTEFILQNTPDRELILSNASLTFLEIDSGTSKYDLTIDLREAANSLQGHLEYRTGLFDESTMVRLWTHYLNLLSSLKRTPDQSIWQLSMLSSAEKSQLLYDFNDTHIQLNHDPFVHLLFEHHAECSPHSLALQIDSHTVSYEDLNQC